MQLAVGLVENRDSLEIELTGQFRDARGQIFPSGVRTFQQPMALTPVDSNCSFTVAGVTIGIGFHWERKESQTFRGGLRIIRKSGGLTAINDVDLEEYVTSVISSEMSASCPFELLKAHAVISRSWVWHPKAAPDVRGLGSGRIDSPGEIVRWYGREAHEDFDVCADDHCQRYQGITRVFEPAAEQAVRDTSRQMLTHAGQVCDARFSKCCGGVTEEFESAWDNRHIPYLVSFYDGRGVAPSLSPQASPEAWILGSQAAWCNTADAALIRQILPNFDQGTQDFYRWTVRYDSEELGEIVRTRLGVNLGRIVDLQPLARGPSARLFRLRLVGSEDSLIVGKELEIRRALSRSHLYSSAFVVERDGADLILKGAGWGHGVGLCQIGAAVMASEGMSCSAILRHYYPGAGLSVL